MNTFKEKLLVICTILSIFLVACNTDKNTKNDSNLTIDNTVKTFKNIGYTDREIELIKKYLSESDIDYLLNYDYVENISEYIGYDIFDASKLNRYIDYKNKFNNLDFYHIILYVNMNLDKDFYEDVRVVSNPDDILVLVNKYNKLPDDYVPNDLVLVDARCSAKDGIYLRSEANDNFYKMCMNMISLNLNMKAISGYRSYEYQTKLHNDYINNDGYEAAIKYSAKPGHSEHETGLVVDVMGSNKAYTNFSDTDEYQYILKHASDYGFIIRYDNEFVTGYINEPWHLRYVGREVAEKLKKDNITLDEYIYLNY